MRQIQILALHQPFIPRHQLPDGKQHFISPTNPTLPPLPPPHPHRYWKAHEITEAPRP